MLSLIKVSLVSYIVLILDVNCILLFIEILTQPNLIYCSLELLYQNLIVVSICETLSNFRNQCR